MNVVRINSAHTTPEKSQLIVDMVREVSDKIAILVDTKGPEVRLTAMSPEDGISVKKGDKLEIYKNIDGICIPGVLFTNYQNFVDDIPLGARILVDDGEIALICVEKHEIRLVCEVENDGVIKGRKSINVPNVSIKLPSLSQKDKEFIDWAIKADIDFIAHSFVRNKEDLLEIDKILKAYDSHLKIISKIENQEGVDNLDTILNHCYGVMVARGDLGVEVPAEKIPAIQKFIVDKCRERKKPVIIATQMLHSMIEHPRPTRAEVTDVANAILQRTDAIMLSGETANGKYPLEAVKIMSTIAKEVEKDIPVSLDINLRKVTKPIALVLARSIVAATQLLPIKAIVLDTCSGRTGRYLSEFRPQIPIYALCYKSYTQRELAMSYDIYPYVINKPDSRDSFIKYSMEFLLKNSLASKGDLVGIIGGSFHKEEGASFMEIVEIK